MYILADEIVENQDFYRNIGWIMKILTTKKKYTCKCINYRMKGVKKRGTERQTNKTYGQSDSKRSSAPNYIKINNWYITQGWIANDCSPIFAMEAHIRTADCMPRLKTPRLGFWKIIFQVFHLQLWQIISVLDPDPEDPNFFGQPDPDPSCISSVIQIHNKNRIFLY